MKFNRTCNSFALLALSLLVVACGRPTVTPALSHLNKGKYQQLIEDKLSVFPNGTEAAFAFISEGSVSFSGVVRRSDTLFPVNNRTSVFEIGSISKVFTSVMLARCINEGLITADASIKPYLGYTLPDSVDITFESLSNHTSGLPRMPSNFTLSALFSQDNPYKNYDEDKLQKYLSGDNLRLRGVGEVKYSNVGAGLLGHLLTHVAERDYESLLKESITEPLDMASTTTNRALVMDDLVLGRDEDGDITSNWDLNVLVGAGGILSTAEDLSTFALAQFDETNQDLSLSREKTTNLHESMGLGLGWHIRYRDNGDVWHWHNGGTGGYRSYLMVDIEREMGIVILCNVSAFHEQTKRVDELGLALMEELTQSGAANP